MKPILAVKLLLLAPLVLPAGHCLHHYPSAGHQPGPRQHRPLRIVRSPQAPKVVRPVHAATPARPLAPAQEHRHRA